MQPENVLKLRHTKIELPKVKIPVGIYGKEDKLYDPDDDISFGDLIQDGYDGNGRTQRERNKVKVKEAIKLLGTWWKLHINCTYVNRGERFLTIYHREISQRKLDISLVSGQHMLVSELQDLVNNLDPRRRVYVGDLKLMGINTNKTDTVKSV